MASIAYWYYITKFVEFADTIFFVLRKKDDHITNLHVIHHGVMPMSVWWGIKFTPGESAVHCVSSDLILVNDRRS